MAIALAKEQFWVEKLRYDQAERQYYECLSKELSEENMHRACVKHKVIADPMEPPICEHNTCAAFEMLLTSKPKVKKPKKLHETKVTPLSSPMIIGAEKLPAETGVTKPNKKSKKKNKTSGTRKPQDEVALAVINSEVKHENLLPSNLNLNFPIGANKSLSLCKTKGAATNSQCTLVSEIAKAREHIKNSLEKMDGIATLAASPVSSEVLDRISAVEKDNIDLRKIIESLQKVCLESEKRIKALETHSSSVQSKLSVDQAALATTKNVEQEDDDGVDLFASDSDEEESAEAARIREERLAAYAAKKSNKPALIAKSSLVLDVKPWDDETDLKAMEAEIRKIVADGLLWGASKFVPVAFGIQKLTISCVVEDDKISIDWLSEEIEKLEDYVQSVDVAAFNKI